MYLIFVGSYIGFKVAIKILIVARSAIKSSLKTITLSNTCLPSFFGSHNLLYCTWHTLVKYIMINFEVNVVSLEP